MTKCRKLLIILAIFLLSGTANAEWVMVDRFTGVQTDVPSNTRGLEAARKSVGWLYDNGTLAGIKIDRIPVKGEAPVSIIGQHSYCGMLLYVSNGDSLYDYSVADGTNDTTDGYSAIDSLDQWDTSTEAENYTYIFYFECTQDSVLTYNGVSTDKVFIGTAGYECWQFVQAHGRKLFYARSSGVATRYGWSELGEYQTHAGIYKPEGNDPIVGLSSFGDQFVIYRRHGIESVTGYTVADFYYSIAPAGIGAVTQHSISRWGKRNTDVFINDAGVWTYDGGTAQQLQIMNTGIFADSINWAVEGKLVGAVWDDKYWMGAPFGAGTTNNRLVVFDLIDGGVTYMSGIAPQSIWVYKGRDDKEILYIGDVSRTDGDDKGTIWQIGASDDSLYAAMDFRANWFDGGDETLQKLIREYEVRYHGANGDSIFVDFYADYSETALWADTIALSAAGYGSHYSTVDRSVRGKVVSYGLRSPDPTVQINGFGVDVVSLGQRRKQ